jgi:hypothetical protein
MTMMTITCATAAIVGTIATVMNVGRCSSSRSG